MSDNQPEGPGREPHPVDADGRDADDLRRLGYAQQLKRSMGAFSSFAVSFSLISITTGIFAGFQLGIRQAGPAVIWSWLIVLAGQVLVALVIAELSKHYPLSGYGYQWTSRLVGPRFGYFVGWLLLLQFLTGFPGVCSALGEYLHGFLGLRPDGWLTAPRLTVGVISAIALLHIGGIRLASRVNDVGVLAEIGGAALITVVLLALFGFRSERGLDFLLDSTNFTTHQPATLGAFALSMLMGAWCLTGFEAAADLAEETHRPRQTVPWAVLGSLLGSGVGGFLMVVAFILAIGNLTEVQQSDTPLLTILRSRLGDRVAGGAMLVVFMSIFACGVASMASTTRLIFSMARDNMLPGSGVLKRVHPGRQSPVHAIVVVWLITAAVVLGFEKLALITSISATAGYLGYAGIILASFRAPPDSGRGEGFHLGRWRMPIAVAALIWTVVVVGALTIPRLDGARLAAWSTLAGIAVGIAVYSLVIRGRIARGQAGPPNRQDPAEAGV
jgi:amino acid transporter